MAIITLTTDFGLKDYFVGALKGSIYNALPNVHIVDISNQVSPFNIQECAYLIKSSYKSFPEGTVHIIGVDSEHSPENQHLALLIDGHYFITANNGVVGLITSEFRPEKVVEINLKNLKKSTFPELDVFVPIACHIARGGTLDVIGRPFEGLKEIKSFNPRITDNKNTLVGSVMYIDNYGNVVTNIHKSEFDKIALGRAYELRVRNKKITTIHQNYNDIINFSLEKSRRKGPGDLLALFNSAGHLELAIYKSDLNTVGGASTLLGLDYRDTITVHFN